MQISNLISNFRVPALGIYVYDNAVLPFPADKEINDANLKEFLTNFLKGKDKAQRLGGGFNSEIMETMLSVKQIRHDSFSRIVLSPKFDVLVLFFRSDDTKANMLKIARIYDTLADKVKTIKQKSLLVTYYNLAIDPLPSQISHLVLFIIKA